MFYECFQSPVGALTAIVADDQTLRFVLFDAKIDKRRIWEAARRGKPTRNAGRLRHVREQLDRYFAGERTAFTIPLGLDGTAFQRRVWNYLLQIPYGETRTYAHVAAALGIPRGARAVGAANGTNPVSIIVPCHRLTGTDGRLTGYAGGLPAKAWLLRLESSEQEP